MDYKTFVKFVDDTAKMIIQMTAMKYVGNMLDFINSEVAPGWFKEAFDFKRFAGRFKNAESSAPALSPSHMYTILLGSGNKVDGVDSNLVRALIETKLLMWQDQQWLLSLTFSELKELAKEPSLVNAAEQVTKICRYINKAYKVAIGAEDRFDFN